MDPVQELWDEAQKIRKAIARLEKRIGKFENRVWDYRSDWVQLAFPSLGSLEKEANGQTERLGVLEEESARAASR